MKRLACLLLFIAASCHHSATEDPLVVIQIQDRNGVTETISAPERLENYGKIDFLTSQPYKKILRVYRKDGKSHTKITTYHPNGVVWQYLEAEEMRAYGAYKEWHPNGQLRIEATVIGGTADVAQGAQRDWLFEGISQVWDEQGRLLAKFPYSQGALEGKQISFYASGQIEKETPYRQNQIEGDLLEYHPSGKLKAKSFYHDGKKSGLSIGYFENGQAAWIEEYSEDLIIKGAYYDPNGKLISQVEDGAGFRALFEKDFVTHLIQIRQGYAEGGVKQYTPKGELQAIYHLKNGRKHGEEISFYLEVERMDGKTDLLPKLSLNWDQDNIHGSVKTWYNNGQIQSQREYSHNKLAGASLAWFRDGSLMMLEEYEGNHLVKGQYYKKTSRDPVSTILNGNGNATIYDENGVFLRKITYAKGEPLDPEN